MRHEFPPYVPVAERRRQAERERQAATRRGQSLSPVVIQGRKLAVTFWGQAWCRNLERYGDYANRLPRGRTYARNGSVIDLQIAAGTVQARVSGSRLYAVEVTIAPLAKARWRALCAACAGAIDSLVELLQGRLSAGVMGHLCEPATGLFPAPKEIAFTCSCPDWAVMCKHVAAVLYGVGARLDTQPELLFKLRQIDQQALVTQAGHELPLSRRAPARELALAHDDLSALFGLDLGRADGEGASAPPRAVAATRRKPSAKPAPRRAASGPARQVDAKPPAAAKRTGRRSKKRA